MKKLITQFDSQRQGVYVTTPSCCGCCCCCCSLATSITSSTLLARRINHEAKKNNIPNRFPYVFLAALYLPIAGIISYLLVKFLAKATEQCQMYNPTGSRGSFGQAYEYCTNPATNLFWLVTGLVFICVLAFLYNKVKMEKPIYRAVLAVISIAILLIAEVYIGAFLIITSAGLGYLIAIPFIFGVVYKLYDATFGKDIVAEKNLVSNEINKQPVGKVTSIYPEGWHSQNLDGGQSPTPPNDNQKNPLN